MTRTDTAVHVAGTGVTFMQFPGKFGSPRFDPVMATTIPGARGPAAIEAAFFTEAAVNVGVCACAESTKTAKEIVMPIVVRTVYPISDEFIQKYTLSVANLGAP